MGKGKVVGVLGTAIVAGALGLNILSNGYKTIKNNLGWEQTSSQTQSIPISSRLSGLKELSDLELYDLGRDLKAKGDDLLLRVQRSNQYLRSRDASRFFQDGSRAVRKAGRAWSAIKRHSSSGAEVHEIGDALLYTARTVTREKNIQTPISSIKESLSSLETALKENSDGDITPKDRRDLIYSIVDMKNIVKGGNTSTTWGGRSTPLNLVYGPR